MQFIHLTKASLGLTLCAASCTPASAQPVVLRYKNTQHTTENHLSKSSWHAEVQSTPDVVVLHCSGPMKYCNRIRTAVSYCAVAHQGLSVIDVHRSVHVVQTLD